MASGSSLLGAEVVEVLPDEEVTARRSEPSLSDENEEGQQESIHEPLGALFQGDDEPRSFPSSIDFEMESATRLSF